AFALRRAQLARARSEAPPHVDEWIRGSSLLDARPQRRPRLRQLLRRGVRKLASSVTTHGLGDVWPRQRSRLYLRSAARSASCEIASVRWPSTPVIVSAATSALMIDSSVAWTVASNTAPIRALESIETWAVSVAPAALGFAVENAMKISPDPLLETLPVRARPRVARRAIRFS